MSRAAWRGLGRQRERAAQAQPSAPPSPAARRGFRGPAGRPRWGRGGTSGLGSARGQEPGSGARSGLRAGARPRSLGARAARAPPWAPAGGESAAQAVTPGGDRAPATTRGGPARGGSKRARERACGAGETAGSGGAERGRNCAPRGAGGPGSPGGAPCSCCLEAGQGRAAAIAPGPWGGRGGRAPGGCRGARGAGEGGARRPRRGAPWMPWKVLARACHDGCVRDADRADPLGARALLSAASHLPVAFLKSPCCLPVFPLIIMCPPKLECPRLRGKR